MDSLQQSTYRKKRKKNTRKRRIIVLRLKLVLFCIVLSGGIFGFLFRDSLIRLIDSRKTAETSAEIDEAEKTTGLADTQTDAARTGDTTEQEEETELSIPVLAETSVYTFLQGPKAWNSKTPWSGSWCEEVLAGQKFSVFGCGLCDLANIYSTLSPYECSPIDMYDHAREVSGYSPGAGYGAIDWIDLKETLEAVGFSCEICDKDPSFEEFCTAMEHAVTAIVLVSSQNDSTYWTDTEGHYVNTWSYNKETQEVFLADSGDPAHNRNRIPLKYVYDALKTSGEHQYLLVYAYSEEKNTWKYSGIKEAWTIPEYYEAKQ